MAKLYIVLSGTASVGKTSVIEELIPILKRKYIEPVAYISEVARSMQKRGYAINKEATTTTQRMIEDEYLRLEDANSSIIRVADRSIIDRYAYSLLNGGCSVSDEKKKLLEWYHQNIVEHCKKYSHIFYIPLTSELKLKEDGVRSTDEVYRKQIDDTQRSIIETYKIPVFTIQGTTQERLTRIQDILEKK